MKPGELDQALRRTNLWWKAPDSWERDDPDLRRVADARFVYEPSPLGDLTPGGLYVLRGPRRVGKSVELKRAVSRLIAAGVDPRRIVHASCEGWRDAQLGALVDVGRRIATRGATGPRYWLIDEITGVVGDWPSRVKWLRDNTDFGQDCVVLTGSSARGLEAATKALAGRRGEAQGSDRTLLPMGFRAFCRAIGLDDPPAVGPIRARDFATGAAAAAAEELHPWLNELVQAWEDYLLVGGFPAAVDDFLRHGEIQPPLIDAFWDVIHGEAVRSDRFSATQTQALLVRLSHGLGAPLNVEGVARDVDASAGTVRSRLRDLQEAYLTWPCYRHRGGVPHLRAQGKVYFTDPLLARLPHLKSPDAVDAPDFTRLTEQQIGMALLRQGEAERPGSFIRFGAVMFERTPARKEIDFVGPWLGGVPFEAKYVDGGWARESRTALAAYGTGVLATRSVIDLDRPVRALPAAIVAWLLDPV